jgi:chemotaxis protein MotA
MKNFEFSTLLGIIIALAMIVIAIDINGNILDFVDLPSVIIVIASTIAITIACFSLEEVIDSCILIGKMSVAVPAKADEFSIKLMKLAEYSYKNGVLSMENSADFHMDSEIFQEGIQLLVDNEHIDNVEKIMSQEIMSKQEDYNVMISMIRKAGETSPSMGLIGTLIGLVQMLGSLSDVKSVGPAMAVALLTTFYGAILAYVVFFPLASKLERNAKSELLNSNLFLHAILSIAKKENPRRLESTLNSILPQDKRIIFFRR